MQHPLVSVIVPVYNADKYLPACLDSLAGQGVKDCEFILVDDGSTDGSLAICQQYAEKDNRFKVFTKPNGGPSSARNLGLDVAKGKYIWFVDADDWIDVGSIDVLLQEMNSDLIYFGFKNIDTNGVVTREVSLTSIPIFYENETDIDNTLARLLNPLNDIAGYSCNKLFKNEIIQKYNLRFDTRVSLGEDAIFTALYWNYICTIQLSAVCPYNYRYVETSLARSSAVGLKFESYAEALNEMLTTIKRVETRSTFATKTFWAYYCNIRYNWDIYNNYQISEALDKLIMYYDRYKPQLGFQGRYMRYMLMLPSKSFRRALLKFYIKYQK